MRILLISIFLITLMGMIFIPNAFGITQLVLIPIGASSGDHFDPNIIEIKKDDTVKWANLDRNTVHTVTSTSTNWTVDSGDLLPNNDENYCYPNCKPSFSYTFDAGGTYDYVCKIHSWMKGVVKVIELGQDAEIKIHGYAGDMYIDKSQYEVIVDDSVKIKIYGEVKDIGINAYVNFTITKPDGSISEQKISRTSEGYYQLILSINYEDRGTYNVVSTFGLENIGTANFVVVERSIPENLFPPSDDKTSPLIQPPVGSSSKIRTSNDLTIMTDFPSYKKGDMITISGMVPLNELTETKNDSVKHLIIQIFDPRNNMVTVSQISPNRDTTYYVSINGEGPMWKFEGDYTVKANFVDSNAETKFAFTIPGTAFDSPLMESQAPSSKTSTLLILHPFSSKIETQGQNSHAEVIVSGILTSSDRQYVITSAKIQLEMWHGMWQNRETETVTLTTGDDGRFSHKSNWGVGDNNTVAAVFDGTSNFEPSKSKTKYFDVISSSQSQPPTSGSLSAVGAVFLLVIIMIVVGVIAIKKRNKKIQPPPTIPSGGGTPSGGTPSGGTPSGGTPSGGTPGGGTPKIWGYSPGGGTPGRRRAQAGAKVISNPFGGSSIWKLIGKPPIVPGGLKKAAKKAVKKAAKKKSKMHNPKYDIRCKKCGNENLIDGMDGLQTCSDPTCGWRNQ